MREQTRTGSSSPLAVMNTIGIVCRRLASSCCRSGPDIPGIATSRIRQLVWLTTSEARNASADENASAAKPNCRTMSGSDSRTDSSSSTTDTSERLPSGCPHHVCVAHNARSPQVHYRAAQPVARLLDFGIDRRTVRSACAQDGARSWTGVRDALADGGNGKRERGAWVHRSALPTDGRDVFR